MATTTELESARAESRRMVSDFFIKSLNVILGARVTSKYLDVKQAPFLDSHNFNLVLVNSPIRNKCHLSFVEPIIVDVLLLHKTEAGKGKPKGGGPQQVDQVDDEQASLIERWVVQCVPRTTAAKASKTPSSTSASTSKLQSMKPPSYRAPENTSHQPWKKATRMLSMMLRSLYSLTRMLPAYKVFQQLEGRTSREGPSSCNFDLSYKVRSTLVASEAERYSRLSKFSLTPVETELGRMCIVVKYSSWECVEKALQRSGSIFSDIIPDYVAGESNPHFAVSDRRISAGTRTRSSNVPLASLVKASGASVRRTYSSPLRVTDEVHEQLVCPFATDDELERAEPICCVQGTSRDAAVGALVTALRQAEAMQQQGHGKVTVGMGLQEMKSYRV